MKQIVALLGDYYHRAEDSQAALDKSLKPLLDNGEVNIRYITLEQVEAVLEERPDLFILFKDDRTAPQVDENARWMTEGVAISITRFVAAGGAWLAWHSGLASYDIEGSYVAMLKGYFIDHPAHNQRVTYTQQDLTTFEILDEHYFVGCKEEETEVFLRSNSVDGSSIAGWRHSFGEGRVCCLTPAHHLEGLLHPDLLAQLEQAISWCFGKK